MSLTLGNVIKSVEEISGAKHKNSEFAASRCDRSDNCHWKKCGFSGDKCPTLDCTKSINTSRISQLKKETIPTEYRLSFARVLGIEPTVFELDTIEQAHKAIKQHFDKPGSIWNRYRKTLFGQSILTATEYGVVSAISEAQTHSNSSYTSITPNGLTRSGKHQHNKRTGWVVPYGSNLRFYIHKMAGARLRSVRSWLVVSQTTLFEGDTFEVRVLHPNLVRKSPTLAIPTSTSATQIPPKTESAHCFCEPIGTQLLMFLALSENIPGELEKILANQQQQNMHTVNSMNLNGLDNTAKWITSTRINVAYASRRITVNAPI